MFLHTTTGSVKFMFGRLPLNSNKSLDLNIEAYTSDRFRQSHQRAFRPEYLEQDSSKTLVLGTLLLQNRSISGLEAAAALNESMDNLRLLDGLYLLIHYDARSNTLSIVNNNYQLTKLYYTVVDNEFLFAHQMELLLPHLKERKPYFPSLLNFFRNGFNQSEKTPIEGINKLLPSQRILVSGEKISLNNSWRDHYIVNRRPFDSIEKKLDEYENIYQSTLKNYLVVRNPNQLGMFLSGGHDTSFLLIQASKVWNQPVHCFTTVFPGWGFSEQSFAESTCNKFGGVFFPQKFGGEDLDLIIDLIHSCEEPVLGSSLPLHALARIASQYTDTMMGGDGGDTLWGEYHPVAEYHRWVHRWPLALRKSVHKIAKTLRDCSDWERFWELEHVAGLFAREDIYENFLGELCTYRHFSPQFINEILVPEISSQLPAKSTLEISFDRHNFDEALIEGKLLNGFFTYQSFQQTRSMNAFGMEFFLPAVQKDLMNFVNSLPMNWLNGGTTFHRLINSKTVNRKFHKFALARYLKKEEIYNRSFDIPWHLVWENRQQTLNLASLALKKRGWFQPEAIDKVFGEFRTQKNKDYELLELKSHGYRVMALLSVEIWARIFVDTPASQPGPEVSLDEFLAQ